MLISLRSLDSSTIADVSLKGSVTLLANLRGVKKAATVKLIIVTIFEVSQLKSVG